MIREMNINDRNYIDEMQFELQKYFSEIDKTNESLPYKDVNDAHQYMQQMINDVKSMNGKIFVAEEMNQIIGYIQGVIIEHKKAKIKFTTYLIILQKKDGLDCYS